jgi:hypothetical protein
MEDEKIGPAEKIRNLRANISESMEGYCSSKSMRRIQDTQRTGMVETFTGPDDAKIYGTAPVRAWIDWRDI